MTHVLDIVGLTLIHFLWEGAVIVVATAATLYCLRRESPQARYVALLVALCAVLVLPVVTMLGLLRPAETDLRVRILPASTTGPSFGQSASGATTPAEAATSLDGPLHIASVVWMIGVLGFCVRLAGGCLRVRTMARGERSSWERVTNDLTTRLGMARVAVVDSVLARTPFVVGWLRPTIVLPLASLAHLSPGQVEAILLHELAHIRRHDFLVNIVQTLGEILLFYHPAVWWISRRLREERELCCDDMVVRFGGNAEVYAGALVELAEQDADPGPDAMALAAARGPLLVRIQRLLRPREKSTSRGRSLGVLLVLLAVMAAVPRFMPSTRAAQTAPEPRRAWRFGPPDVNRLIGFELFPGPIDLLGDPKTVAWRASVRYPAGELSLHGFGVRSLIRMAYGLPEVRISGPDWIDRESLDLTIDADHLPNSDELAVLVRQTLEDRLRLAMHTEKTDVPLYALVVSNTGLRTTALRPSSSNCLQVSAWNARAAAGNYPGRGSRLCGIDHRLTGITLEGATMGAFAEQLARQPFMDREVVDRTGLVGAFDGELHLGLFPAVVVASRHQSLGAWLRPLGFDSVFTALPEQLGLGLEATTAVRDLLVVDSLSRP